MSRRAEPLAVFLFPPEPPCRSSPAVPTGCFVRQNTFCSCPFPFFIMPRAMKVMKARKKVLKMPKAMKAMKARKKEVNVRFIWERGASTRRAASRL